jgi:chromate transporter
MNLRRLALHFLRIGATGFGGPMALIGLMQDRLVEKEQAIKAEEFSEGVALGQVLPGPIAVDCATYIGYRLRGFWGALVTTGALVLPAFVAMLILTPIYLRYGTVPHLTGFFKGVGAGVVAVIVAACVRLGQRGLRAPARRGTVLRLVIAIAALVGGVAQAQPILLILGAGALGLLFFVSWPRPEPESVPEPKEPA